MSEQNTLSINNLDLDPESLCKRFAKVYDRKRDRAEQKMSDFAWRVILGDDYAKACEIRQEIIDHLYEEFG